MPRYYRIHSADIAYLTWQPRGIFTAIWKAVKNTPVDLKVKTERL
ncbi:hypothetical protein [Treponema sp.]